MAKIIYLGETLDAEKEHELFTDNEYGFKIDIKYTDDSWYPDKKDRAYNCTEFHWRYNESREWEKVKDVAFESDIHMTGFTRKLDVIESVTISLAEKLYEDYRE